MIGDSVLAVSNVSGVKTFSGSYSYSVALETTISVMEKWKGASNVLCFDTPPKEKVPR